jgi:hypothetical protein
VVATTAAALLAIARPRSFGHANPPPPAITG